MITYALLDEAAVNAALTFKDENLTVEQLEEIAGVVQAALADHFKWKIQGN